MKTKLTLVLIIVGLLLAISIVDAQNLNEVKISFLAIAGIAGFIVMLWPGAKKEIEREKDEDIDLPIDD